MGILSVEKSYFSFFGELNFHAHLLNIGGPYKKPTKYRTKNRIIF
jgi:hypothetical protein